VLLFIERDRRLNLGAWIGYIVTFEKDATDAQIKKYEDEVTAAGTLRPLKDSFL
jgi:hypothetical protein